MILASPEMSHAQQLGAHILKRTIDTQQNLCPSHRPSPPLRIAYKFFGDRHWHRQHAAELERKSLAVVVEDVVVATTPFLGQDRCQLHHLLCGQVRRTQRDNLSMSWTHAARMHPLQPMGSIRTLALVHFNTNVKQLKAGEFRQWVKIVDVQKHFAVCDSQADDERRFPPLSSSIQWGTPSRKGTRGALERTLRGLREKRSQTREIGGAGRRTSCSQRRIHLSLARRYLRRWGRQVFILFCFFFFFFSWRQSALRRRWAMTLQR